MPAKQVADTSPDLHLRKHHATAVHSGTLQMKTYQSISPSPTVIQLPMYFGG